MIDKKMKPEEILAIVEREPKSHEPCKYSSGYITEEDLTNLAHYMRITESELKEAYLEEVERFNTKAHRPKLIKKGKPYGQCIFLKEGKCSIENVKPFHCRITNQGKTSEEVQQWFDLNFFVNPNDDNSLREYVQASKVREVIKGGKIDEIIPQYKAKKIMESE